MSRLYITVTLEKSYVVANRSNETSLKGQSVIKRNLNLSLNFFGHYFVGVKSKPGFYMS